MRGIAVLILQQNLVMIAFVLMIAYTGSFANQIILSIIAITYWLTAYAMIRQRTKRQDSKS